MDTTSLWEKISVRSIDYPPLTQNLTVDILIIGAGITGITAALELVSAGKKVAVVEAYQVGGVTTGLSSGNLYVAVQPYYQHIKEKFDFETATTIAASRRFAIDYIEKMVQEKNSHCNFSRRPWYIYTDKDQKISFLEKEVELFKTMGIPIAYTQNLPLAFKFKKAAVMQNQARFNPLQYVIDMSASVQKQGGSIFEKTKIINIIEKRDYCIADTESGYQIKARHVFIATHTPIGIHSVQLFTAPYRSYAVAGYTNNNQYPEGHFWDLDEPHHATSTHAISTDHPEILLVAGNHHKTGQDSKTNIRYQELEKFLAQHLTIEKIAYRWSSQHFLSADDVPYLGLVNQFSRNTYMATVKF